MLKNNIVKTEIVVNEIKINVLKASNSTPLKMKQVVIHLGYIHKGG